MATKPKSRKVKSLNGAHGANGQNGHAHDSADMATDATDLSGRESESLKKSNDDTPISNRRTEALSLPEINGTDNPEPKARVKKKRPPSPATRTDAPAERDSVHTVEERMQQLGSIESLKKPLPPEDEAVSLSEVDSSAPPPDEPVPAPEPEPMPSGNIDRGAPIPEHYAMDRLMVLVRDPYWLYLYWELKGGSLERLRFQHSAEIIDTSRWVLRVKTLHMPQMNTVDRGANEYIVDIDLRVGQWYLKVSPSTTFRIDLGFIDQQGNFVMVVPGNEVRTPAPGVSNISDERWMIMREELEKLLKIGGSPHPVAPFPSASSAAAQRIQRSEKPRSLGLFSSHTVIQRSE